MLRTYYNSRARMIFEKIACLISSLTLLEAGGSEICYVDEPDKFITKRLVFCDEFLEKCCSTGCCRNYGSTVESNGTTLEPVTMFCIFIGVILSIMIILFCKKKCLDGDESSTRNDNPVTSPSRDDSPRPPTVSLNLLPAIRPEINPSAPPESTRGPITPPPDYNSAVAASFLHPDNRIPSYEDVMAAEWKNKSVPG